MSLSQLSAGTQAVCLRFAQVHTMYGVACSVGIPCRLVGCLWGLGWSSGCCTIVTIAGVCMGCHALGLLCCGWREGREVYNTELCAIAMRVALPHVCAGLPAQSCRHTGCQPHCMPFWSAAQQHSVTWQCWEQASAAPACLLVLGWWFGLLFVHYCVHGSVGAPPCVRIPSSGGWAHAVMAHAFMVSWLQGLVLDDMQLKS